MPRTPRGETRGDWAGLTTTVTPEIAKGFPDMELARAKLLEIEEEADRLVVERDFHQARKQEATVKLQSALEEGRKAASFLRACLRRRFGDRNEQLVAFGIKPFRGRKRSKKAPSPAGEAKNAGVETADPSGGQSS